MFVCNKTKTPYQSVFVESSVPVRLFFFFPVFDSHFLKKLQFTDYQLLIIASVRFLGVLVITIGRVLADSISIPSVGYFPQIAQTRRR